MQHRQPTVYTYIPQLFSVNTTTYLSTGQPPVSLGIDILRIYESQVLGPAVGSGVTVPEASHKYQGAKQACVSAEGCGCQARG